MNGSMLSSTENYLEVADSLTQMMALKDGPNNAAEQIGIAQVNALIAIAQELKRANDWNESEAERQELKWTEAMADSARGESF